MFDPPSRQGAPAEDGAPPQSLSKATCPPGDRTLIRQLSTARRYGFRCLHGCMIAHDFIDAAICSVDMHYVRNGRRTTKVGDGSHSCGTCILCHSSSGADSAGAAGTSSSAACCNEAAKMLTLRSECSHTTRPHVGCRRHALSTQIARPPCIDMAGRGDMQPLRSTFQT